MGQSLSEPVTAKESTSCQNSRFKVGSSCMQGWRVTMEDSHTHILSLPDDPEAAFFAVYDGHGGANVAQDARSNLHKFLVQRQAYQNGDIATAFREGFLEFDNTMMKDEAINDKAGTTAVTVLIKGDQLYCGNLGDSRAVASIKGKDHPLSLDHKPNNPLESVRIKDAGGWVSHNRVNGKLALSRAFGDFMFKRNASKTAEEQMVIALPDVERRTITEEWEFLVLACDGIWEVLTNSGAVDLIRYCLGVRMEPEKICEELMTNCLSTNWEGRLGHDNMTVILVCFLQDKTWDEYCAKIASSLEPNIDEGFITTLLNGLSDDEVLNDEDGDVFVVEDVDKPGDNVDSVTKNNQNTKMEDDVKFESDVEEGKSQEDVDQVNNIIINDLDEDGVMNGTQEGRDTDEEDDSGATVEGSY